MIWESWPWKTELLRTIDRSERVWQRMWRANCSDWPEFGMQFERAVFVSAFIVRKLMDSNRLSMQVERTKISATVFGLLEETSEPDSLTWERVPEFYDLDLGFQKQINLRQLVSWLIHSYVFWPETKSDYAGGIKLVSFYCNSDHTKPQLVRVAWPDYRRLLELVARDEVNEMAIFRDAEGNEVWLRSSVPMTEAEIAQWMAEHPKELELLDRLHAVPQNFLAAWMAPPGEETTQADQD